MYAVYLYNLRTWTATVYHNLADSGLHIHIIKYQVGCNSDIFLHVQVATSRLLDRKFFFFSLFACVPPLVAVLLTWSFLIDLQDVYRRFYETQLSIYCIFSHVLLFRYMSTPSQLPPPPSYSPPLSWFPWHSNEQTFSRMNSHNFYDFFTYT